MPLEQRKLPESHPARSAGRDVMRDQAGARRSSEEATERTALLPREQSSRSTGHDLLRDQMRAQSGDTSSTSEKVKWDNKDALFKRDRQKETDLLNRYYGAKGQITEWTAKFPGQEWASAIGKSQIAEIDAMYNNHLHEINTERDVRDTMREGPTDTFLARSYLGKIKEVFVSGSDLSSLQKVYDTHESTMQGITARQSDEWTTLQKRQQEYRQAAMKNYLAD
jgi:hypothetical protein